ncbi:hypothetical protein QBC40DRAFT_310712 [Triangularia verruculosa]|uniref:FluG domain-containing protein n=1 Tax=Triangularia verruculosa TaxID=2587418 RepID=A0AAN7AQG5_9PEZI|nr:hypothetical protein QBC40DRAFT_310712 [Triangularia verruculosa]
MDFLDHLCEKYKISSWGTSWEYFRQYKQLYARVVGQYIDCNNTKEWYDAELISKHGLRASNRHRINLSGCYLFLMCTGCRPAEIVDNEKKKPKDGSWEEIYGPKAICPRDRDTVMRLEPATFDNDYVAAQVGARKDSAKDKLPDKVVKAMLANETMGRGRPKALYYKDILLMVVRHPVTGDDVLTIAVKFIHHKGADNKPKPTIFHFTLARRPIFCLITIIVSIAVHDRAFDTRNLTSVASVFGIKNTGPVQCTPLRWKKEWLKRPVFRRFNGSEISEHEAMQYPRLRDDMAQHAYINPKVKFHLQNAVLHEPHENALLEMLTYISVMRDPRAGRDIVPDEVWQDMTPDPEILIRNKKAQRVKKIVKEYRDDYFYNPEILYKQPEDLTPAQLPGLRIRAAELMVALCDKRETKKRDAVRRRPPAEVVVKEESPRPDPFPLLMERTQCPQCIGDKRLSYEERTFKYCRPAVMYDHFDREYAKQLKGANRMLCNHPKCREEELEFKHLNHFKNHVERIHGVRLRA